MEKIETYLQTALDVAVFYIPKLLLAIIILLIGLKLISLLVKLFDVALQKSDTDATLRPFLKNLTAWLLKLMLFISLASMLGIETTSFVAVLGAASFAVGLALQGSLANFAGGALILLFRPYKVGDLVEIEGHWGYVREIQLFTTILVDVQNKTIILPNGSISNGNIINYSKQGAVRIDIVIGIAYDADIQKAKIALLEMMKKNDKILKTPPPFVGVESLGDSSVNLAVRPHVHPNDYWAVYFYCTEAGKLALDKVGVTIPFPQIDVHLNNLK